MRAEQSVPFVAAAVKALVPSRSVSALRKARAGMVWRGLGPLRRLPLAPVLVLAAPDREAAPATIEDRFIMPPPPCVLF